MNLNPRYKLLKTQANPTPPSPSEILNLGQEPSLRKMQNNLHEEGTSKMHNRIFEISKTNRDEKRIKSNQIPEEKEFRKFVTENTFPNDKQAKWEETAVLSARPQSTSTPNVIHMGDREIQKGPRSTNTSSQDTKTAPKGTPLLSNKEISKFDDNGKTTDESSVNENSDLGPQTKEDQQSTKEPPTSQKIEQSDDHDLYTNKSRDNTKLKQKKITEMFDLLIKPTKTGNSMKVKKCYGCDSSHRHNWTKHCQNRCFGCGGPPGHTWSEHCQNNK